MPNVLTEDGFDVMIHSDDHRPAHVHVYKSGLVVISLNNKSGFNWGKAAAIYKSGLVVISLNNRRTVRPCAKCAGMSRKDVRDALLLVTAKKRLLVKEWRRIHAGRQT